MSDEMIERVERPGTLAFINQAFRNIDITLSAADILDISDALADHTRAAIEATTVKGDGLVDLSRLGILSDEVSAVHDALGYLENFEVREPDLHLTRVECRAILREASKALKAAIGTPEAADTITTLKGEIERLTAAIDLAARTFRHYERLHREKHTADGMEKAMRNADYARQMEAAIGKTLIENVDEHFARQALSQGTDNVG